MTYSRSLSFIRLDSQRMLAACPDMPDRDMPDRDMPDQTRDMPDRDMPD